ncbi:MAG: hypothetical protein Q9170_003316 [Blastenia crenularia]
MIAGLVWVAYSQTEYSSRLTQAPSDGSYADSEAPEVDTINMISDFAGYQQMRNLSSSSTQAAQSIAVPFLPLHASTLGNGTGLVSSRGSDNQIPAQGPSVLCSGRIVTKILRAPFEVSKEDVTPCEKEGSFENNDSALGESLSEADIQKQEPPVSPTSLIVKFSTSNPGRINAIERRPLAPSHEQKPLHNKTQDYGEPFQSRGRIPTSMGPDHVISTPKSSDPTPPRRGRPPGSKNKNPSMKLQKDGSSGSQGQTPIPFNIPLQHQGSERSKKTSPSKLSEVMKMTWAKRRSNGTDGRHGGPPTKKTIFKRERQPDPLNKDIMVTTIQAHDNPNLQRQLFKGQQAIRSASGPRLPMLAPKFITNDRNLQYTGQNEVSNASTIQTSAPVTPSTEPAALSALPAPCTDDPDLTKIFNTYIYPILIKLRMYHQGSLPDKNLIDICKQDELSAELHSKEIRPRSPRPLGLSGTRLPSVAHPELELAAANAFLGEFGVERPYKSLKKGHCDFVREEYLLLLSAVDILEQAPYQAYTNDVTELQRELKIRLGSASEERMTAIIKAAHAGTRTVLARRKKKSIRAFMTDLIEDAIPPFVQPRLAVPLVEARGTVSKPKKTFGSLLRNREFGYDSPARSALVQDALQVCVAEDIRPWRSWKGASSDVVTVAWAPDSLHYAAGAAAQSDENDLQYNRPRNLLIGDLSSNRISELPDHRIERPKPETVSSGPNSTYAVYRACDPMVYKTVTSVQFAPQGGKLYTASDDKTVKIWDISSGKPANIATLHQDAEVTSLECSIHYPGYFATAAKCIENAVRIYQPEQQGSPWLGLSSSRASKHRKHDIFPECIRWGLTSGTKHLLLAGFQQWADHDFSAARQGQICLWDINSGANFYVRPHASAIFSVAWHPQDNIFVTGGAPGGGPLSFPRTTKSVVRSYDVRNTSSYTHEFECPALDMQDVTFHPTNSSYVTAGCTNGTTYVWDYRWPDEVMHELNHGEPLQELVANEEELPYLEHREKVDAGVMLSIWGKGASLFYTGSSDGVVKAWDIFRAPEDVWIRDVAHLPAGIQSGALSPDGMNMLVGDAVGGVHVLSACPFGSSSTDEENTDSFAYNPALINFVYADEGKDEKNIDNPGTEGIELARQLLNSSQIALHPLFGAGKGPNYQGPFADSSRWLNLSSGFCELRPEIDRQQAISINGEEQLQHSSRIKILVAARKKQMQAIKHESSLPVSFGPLTPFVANRCASKTTASAKFAGRTLVSNQTKDHYGSLQKPLSTRQPPSVRPSASRITIPSALSPAKSTASEPIDLTTGCNPTSPFTSKKRRRPSSPSTTQPNTPDHASKRLKLEYVSPLQFPYKSPRRWSEKVEVIDLTTDDGVGRRPSLLLGLETVATVNMNSVVGEGGKMEGKKKDVVVIDLSEEEEEEENVLSWEEWVEEDYWWPEGW